MSLWNFGANQFWHLLGRCKKTDFLPDRGNHLFKIFYILRFIWMQAFTFSFFWLFFWVFFLVFSDFHHFLPKTCTIFILDLHYFHTTVLLTDIILDDLRHFHRHKTDIITYSAICISSFYANFKFWGHSWITQYSCWTCTIVIYPRKIHYFQTGTFEHFPGAL